MLKTIDSFDLLGNKYIETAFKQGWSKYLTDGNSGRLTSGKWRTSLSLNQNKKDLNKFIEVVDKNDLSLYWDYLVIARRLNYNYLDQIENNYIQITT